MKKAKDQPESEPAELASLVGERIRKIRKEEGLSLELFALSQQMMLRPKSPLDPAIDQIKSLALWSKLWSKPNEVSL